MEVRDSRLECARRSHAEAVAQWSMGNTSDAAALLRAAAKYLEGADVGIAVPALRRVR